MDYITKNKVQISYMDFRGLCVRWAGWDVWGNEIDSDISFAKFGYPVPSDEKFEIKGVEDNDREK